MAGRISINSLLSNQVLPDRHLHQSSDTRDVGPVLRHLSDYLNNGGTTLHVPADLYQALLDLSNSLPISLPLPPPLPPLVDTNARYLYTDMSSPSEIEYNISMNDRTTLSKLLHFDNPGAYVEFPETNTNNPVGLLFRMDPNNWRNPMLDFAYSRGAPCGSSRKGRDVFTDLLFDETTGISVPCKVVHYTCRGVKVCPMADIDSLSRSHTSASRNDITQRLLECRDLRAPAMTPSGTVFEKTSALIAALRRAGCHAAEQEITYVGVGEVDVLERDDEHNKRMRRGYKYNYLRCAGRINFCVTASGQPLVICEHYDAHTSRDHFYLCIDSSYDADYLEAYFEEDTEELDRIEQEAQGLGFGPLVKCTTVVNTSSKRVVCPLLHRHSDGQALTQHALKRMECQVKFRKYEPLEGSRAACPWVLITVKGEHLHPIPLPQTTPYELRDALFNLFHKLQDELADLTAHRFLRHPVLIAFLHEQLPGIKTPVLSDLHVSLANREHLRVYINQAKAIWFPHGTGWEGALHLKRVQQETYPVAAQYIRRIIDSNPGFDNSIKIIICMSPEGSRRLHAARFVQSDIAFKRVVGYQEFEMAAFDRSSCSSFTFCRAFVTSESAEAHQCLFEAIDDIVKEDCGQGLRWYHLHARDETDFESSILLFVADHHAGQAKGLGLYLRSRAQMLPSRLDFADRQKTVAQLDVYDHLNRIFRACEVHFFRNIRACQVPEDVRDIMRSLACMEHPNLQGAYEDIVAKGGKHGKDWLDNKLNGKFVLPGLCWALSSIPFEVWISGPRNTNIVEISHRDVNIEGTACTLVGGLEKARRYDQMKLSTLRAYDDHGILSSFRPGHLGENARLNLRRQFHARHKQLTAQDSKIEDHNMKFMTAHGKFTTAQALKENAQNIYNFAPTPQHDLALKAALKKFTQTEKAMNKLIEAASGLEGGTGKIEILQSM